MKKFTLSLLLHIFFISLYAKADNPATPVRFLENKGQRPSEILYEAQLTSTPLYLLKNGISFHTNDPDQRRLDHDADTSFIVWNMHFANSNPDVSVIGTNGTPSVFSYLCRNDPSKWVIHPTLFEGVRYNEIYKNTNLIYYANGNNLKYDFELHSGSDLSAIKTYYSGIQKLKINSQGDLVVTTSYGDQIQKAPIAWQTINNVKVPVEIKYKLLNDSTFGYQAIKGYDKSTTLIVDPLFQMVWASYTQATGFSNNINYCFGSTMDKNSDVYLTGMVDGTYPITPGAYSGPGNIVPEIFVSKFSADGTTMLYSTYLSGNSSEHGVAIAVDDSGRAYVTGVIDLNITGLQTFPSTPNAFQQVHNAGSDAFLTVLNPTGTGLVYSTFLGGDGGESGYSIALGANGIAYIVGGTSGGTFPLKNSGIVSAGGNEAFVAKFDINQSGANSLVYSVRIGGGAFNTIGGRGLAVSDSGEVYITGTVFNGFGTFNFPTTPGAYQTVYNGGMDNIMSFLSKLSNTIPVTLSYSTLLGPGTASAVALHKPTGEAIVVGATSTFTFPVTPGVIQPVHAGNNGADAFVMRMNATGTGLVYSTYLGGPLADVASGVAINSQQETYITGIAFESFPTSPGAFQPNNAGTYDFFVAHLNADATAYSCGGATYVGGSDADYSGSFYDYPSPRITLRDYNGVNDTILISSTSHSQDFPTTPGVYGPVKVNSIADQPVFFKLTCATTAAPPVAAFNTTAITTCGSASINFTDLTTNSPTTWQWNFPGAVPASSNIQNPQNITYTNSGIYIVQLLACNSAGCDSITDTLQITIPQNITVNLGLDSTLCQGENLLLTANSGMATYTWQLNGVAIGNTQSIIASQPGSYSVEVTDTSGCTGNDTIQISVSIPIVSLGNDISICDNGSANVFATSGFVNYSWQLNGNSFGGNSDSIIAVQPGIYSVTVTDSAGCNATDTIVVIISQPIVSLGNDTSFCSGDSIIIISDPNYSQYTWMLNGLPLGITTNNLLAFQSGTYSLTITDSIGCTASDSIMINEIIISLSLPGDTSFCSGGIFNVNGGVGFSSYQWLLNGNPFSNTQTVNISTSGNYSLLATNNEGCTARDSFNVVVNSLPPVETINDTTICEGQSITLTTTGAINYSWDPGTYLSSTSVSSPVSAPSTNITYTVSGTDANGCTGTDQTIIDLTQPPQADFAYTLSYGCAGVVLQTDNKSSNSLNYQWSFGDGKISTEIEPIHIYSELPQQPVMLIAYNEGCSDTTVVNISFSIPVLQNVPNVFTPNGDGNNDCFELRGITPFAGCYKLIIFNRWGSKVFSSEEVSECWYGTSDEGASLPAGVYFYVIQVGETKHDGAVNLMREKN